MITEVWRESHQRILPYLKEGNLYDVACEYAGYRHSKSSLTKEEIENKVLKGKLEVLLKTVSEIRWLKRF